MVTLDGYIEDTGGSIDWTKPREEVNRYINELKKNIDINFYGRKMSEAMYFFGLWLKNWIWSLLKAKLFPVVW